MTANSRTALLAPACAIYALFVLWPLVQVGWIALHRWNGYDAQSWAGFTNFTTLWGDTPFRLALQHTLAWEAGAILLASALQFGLALLFRRSGAQALFLSILLFPALLPATVVAAVWVLVYSPLHGIDAILTWAGLGKLVTDWLGDPHLAPLSLFAAWLWSILGIGAIIFGVGLGAIGREYQELALVEGAGPFQRLRLVTLPGLRRTFVVGALVNTALGLQVFDLIFVTTGGGPGNATMTLALDAYGRAFGGQGAVGEGAATACIQVALGIILLFVALLLAGVDEGMDNGEQERVGDRGRPQTTVAATAILALLLLPFVWLPVLAIRPSQSLALGNGGSAASAWDHVTGVWNAGMGGATATSLELAVLVTALTLMLAAPAAFALARGDVAPRRWTLFILALLLLGLLQPTPVLIIPLFFLLHDLGMLNSIWGIIAPETARSLPFAILVLWGYWTGTSRATFEAAAIDGADLLRQLVRVAIPLARPALAAAAIWTFVSSWNEYLLPTLVSQDGSLQTVPTLLATLVGHYDTQYGLLAAGAIMAASPALCLYLLLRGTAAAGLSRVERGVR